MIATLDTLPAGMTEHRKQRISESVEMFLSGTTMTNIAKHFGVTTEMTRLDLAAVGVSLETKRIKRIEDVEKLAAEGLMPHDIAARVGIPVARVRSIARANNYTLVAPTLLKDTHGQLQCYRNGCRCAPCTDAQRMHDAKFRRSPGLLATAIPN